jgi:mannose-6-phosphate isomerase-like protein (cupin superfamily)
MDAPIRRVITGTNDEGRSCVTSDEAIDRTRTATGRPGLLSSSYLEITVPLRALNGEIDPLHEMPLVPSPGGILIKHVRFPPREGSAAQEGAVQKYYDESRGSGMHATPTLDLVVVLEGSIDLVLEADRVSLNTGDSVIQRGTWHSWENYSDEQCRLLVVNIAAA